MAIHRHSLESVKKVSVEGGSVEVRFYQPHCKEAAERIPLLLTHGGPGGSSVGLYDALHPLADRQPTIFYDQLGSFTSPAELLPEQMTLKRFASEPLSILDDLRIPIAHVFGHSWGGSVMTQFCLDHPDRVETLLLSSPLLSTQRWVEDCKKMCSKIISELGASVDLEHEFERRHFFRSEQDSDALRSERLRTNKNLYEMMWGPCEFQHQGMLCDLDFFPDFHNLSMPILLICGEHDTATPKTMQAAKRAIGTNAQVSIIKNSGHKTYLNCNQEFIDVLNEFLDQQS